MTVTLLDKGHRFMICLGCRVGNHRMVSDPFRLAGGVSFLKSHRDKHPEHVEGCYPCKLLTIAFGAVPDGTRVGHTPKG